MSNNLNLSELTFETRGNSVWFITADEETEFQFLGYHGDSAKFARRDMMGNAVCQYNRIHWAPRADFEKVVQQKAPHCTGLLPR